MTLSPVRDTSRPVSQHTARFTRWGGWLAFLLLAGHLIFCHGCHGDEDNELCVPPLLREKSETRNPKSERNSKEKITNPKLRFGDWDL
jgi:hypothetical protein